MGPTALPPHRLYYLHNFVRALDWLRTRYADVLGAPEQDFIARFAQLPEPAQALLVRLVLVVLWLNRERLNLPATLQPDRGTAGQAAAESSLAFLRIPAVWMCFAFFFLFARKPSTSRSIQLQSSEFIQNLIFRPELHSSNRFSCQKPMQRHPRIVG